jgi:hypothetical protein
VVPAAARKRNAGVRIAELMEARTIFPPTYRARGLLLEAGHPRYQPRCECGWFHVDGVETVDEAAWCYQLHQLVKHAKP